MKQAVVKLIALVAITGGLVYIAPDKAEKKPYAIVVDFDIVSAEGVIPPLSLSIPPPPSKDLVRSVSKEPITPIEQHSTAAAKDLKTADVIRRLITVKKTSVAERKIADLSRTVEELRATVKKTKAALEKKTAPVKFTGILMRVHDPHALVNGTSTCVWCRTGYKALLEYGYNWTIGLEPTNHFWITQSANPDDGEPIFQVVINGEIQKEKTIPRWPGSARELIDIHPKLKKK